jgi:hypothetical protein
MSQCSGTRAVTGETPLAGSNSTALSRLKAKGTLAPARTSASARIRAVTSFPAICVTTKVSGARWLHHIHMGVDDFQRLRVAVGTRRGR